MSTGRRLQDDHCDEDVLLARAMAGDRIAFDLLAERHRASVLRAARAQLGNYHDAEEVTQETFLRAWRALHHLREPARFAARLGRIVRSRCATFRATWRQPTLPLDELLDSTGTAEPSPDRSIRAERAALRDAVEELTAPHRAALELHYL
ncbi:MAG TPA: RNA polymerase sigma factor, partial [Chloroflexota bacterium]|nr:RNA polymerase sigma factor [Chloroflexota bacterium]